MQDPVIQFLQSLFNYALSLGVVATVDVAVMVDVVVPILPDVAELVKLQFGAPANEHDGGAP
jgi:hypothetical protein